VALKVIRPIISALPQVGTRLGGVKKTSDEDYAPRKQVDHHRKYFLDKEISLESLGIGMIT